MRSLLALIMELVAEMGATDGLAVGRKASKAVGTEGMATAGAGVLSICFEVFQTSFERNLILCEGLKR